MNPLALISMPYRILAVVVLGLTLVAFGWVKGAQHGEAKLNAHIVKEQAGFIAGMKAAAIHTAAWQKGKDDAIKAANIRSQRNRVDAGLARSELDGLRRDLANSRANLSSASIGSLRKRIAALEDVFEQCSGRYSGVAEKADGHASDALMFEQAWPK